MEVNWLDYEHSIIQVMNAIREYIGISVHHTCDKDVKQWLSNNQFKQVIVLLIDGMGAYQLEKYCGSKSFLRTHLKKPIHTVFPPTTSAATTSVLTGKMPCETGWLGWQQYFKEINEHLIMFLNEGYYSNAPYLNSNYTYEHVSFLNMIEECRAQHITANDIYPAFREHGVHNFDEMCERIVGESTSQKNAFVYCYWDAYDSHMHMHGVDNEGSIQVLQDIDTKLAQMMPLLNEDTGLVIIADHGHIDVKHDCFTNYPDILDCFRLKPSLEARTINFYIKQDKYEQFEECFLKHFKNSFKLMRKQEVLDTHVFGYGNEHPLFKEFIGDYLAVAIADLQITYDESRRMLGDHSGTTMEEMQIPLILYTTKEKRKQ